MFKPPSIAVWKIVDHSVAMEPENEGLAPEDAGAVRYVSQDTEGDDDATDPLTRHRVRFLASAREYNHLPLRWASINKGERRVLRESIEAAMGASATRTGAVAIAMCALLALRPAEVSALAIHSSLENAITSLEEASTTLLWVGDALIALQGVPRPECAYRQKKDALLLPHRPYKALGIPTEISRVIAEAGGQSHDRLLRCFPTLVTAARTLAANLRRETGARLHLGRIQRSVADCLMELTHDECIAGVILPGANMPNGAGIYYSAIPAEKAYDLHRQAASGVLPWAIEEPPSAVADHFRGCHVGSELLIPKDALCTALGALHERARIASATGRRTIDNIANAFNLQTMHLVAICALWTTHRPTHAPSPQAVG